MDGDAPAVDPLDEVRVMADPSNPDAVLVWLPEFTRLDTVAWSVEIGVPRALLPDLRSALETVDAPVSKSAPAVRATRFEVSLLPEDDINYPFYTVAVEDRGNDRWAVVRHRQCLGVDGEWSWESIPSEREDEWLASHRFDLDAALDLAREAAPGVTVNGVTAAEVLRRREAA